MDPANFATELGVLAMQGFDNMGERARGLMIWNKFIATQPSRALRWHLDGASAEASIGDIVDSCQVWKSHAEDGYDGPDLRFPHTIASVEEEGRPAVGSVASDMLRQNKELFLPLPALPPPVVIRGSSDCELLIQRFVAAVRAGTDAPTVVPGLDEGIDPSSPLPLEPSLEEEPTVRGWNRVCFSCGHQGHGVSRCSKIDTSFPFLLAGWFLVSEMAVTERHGRAWMDGAIRREKGDGPGGRVSLPDHPGSSAGLSFSASILRIDGSCVLHPFTPHKLDVGDIRLLTIAHAFNYRMAVLRDGVKSAVQIGRSRKAEGRFLKDMDISWGLQVAAMFQIMSTMALELPSFLEALEDIWGISPYVQLDCEPWGHMDHSDGQCSCRFSDRTTAYVHELSLMSWDLAVPSSSGRVVTRSARTSARLAVEPCLVLGRPGMVPFVSDRPDAYGHLLLAVYVRWKSGVMVPSDWLRPVRRGGWRTGVPERVRGLDDVS